MDSNYVVPKDKEQVTKTDYYLAKWLATLVMLVDKNMLVVLDLNDTILRGEGGRWRGIRKILFFDIAWRIANEFPLTMLVELDCKD